MGTSTVGRAATTRRRREQVLAIVEDHGFVRVTDLGEMFHVSSMTVRSDLEALSRAGHLRRIRGGAVRFADVQRERAFEETSAVFALEKSAIGRVAAELVSSGETVILDVGTTTTAVALALLRREQLASVTVITSGLNIALKLEAAVPRIGVIVTGGTLRPLQHSLVNPMGSLVLERIAGATLFLGCNGVHPSAGVTNINLEEADIKRQMLRAARRVIAVADGSKIGQIQVVRLCDIVDLDLLITGQSADARIVEDLLALGLEVVIAP